MAVQNFLYSILCAVLCISVGRAMEKNQTHEASHANVGEEIDALKKTLAQAYKRVHEIHGILACSDNIHVWAGTFDELYDYALHIEEFPSIADKLLDTWDMMHVSDKRITQVSLELC